MRWEVKKMSNNINIFFTQLLFIISIFIREQLRFYDTAGLDHTNKVKIFILLVGDIYNVFCRDVDPALTKKTRIQGFVPQTKRDIKKIIK